MEQLWVALLAVGTTLFSSGVCGSILHGVAGGPSGYLQLIPHELVYSNVHSPSVVLSQLHGLTIDEALAISGNGHGHHNVAINQAIAASGENGQQQQHDALAVEELSAIGNGNEQGQSPTPASETLSVSGNAQESAPAPVVEESEEADKHKLITQEQLYEQLFGRPSESPEATNAIENGITSVGVETVVKPSPEQSVNLETQSSPSVLDLLVPTQSGSEGTSVGVETVLKTSPEQSVNLETQPSPTVLDLLVPPQSESEATPVQSSNTPIPVTPEQEAPLEPAGPTSISKDSVAKLFIDTDIGKLRMQASLTSSTAGEGIKVSDGDIPNLTEISVPVIIPELPAPESGITKDSSKPHIVTNVNVHVNVNGDGKGSVINSTSVAEITAPIKTNHEKCD